MRRVPPRTGAWASAGPPSAAIRRTSETAIQATRGLPMYRPRRARISVPSLLVELVEDFLGCAEAGVGRRLAGVERHLQDDLHDLLAGEPVVEPPADVRPELRLAAQRRERGDRDHAPVRQLEAGAAPDLAEQDLVADP